MTPFYGCVYRVLWRDTVFDVKHAVLIYAADEESAKKVFEEAMFKNWEILDILCIVPIQMQMLCEQVQPYFFNGSK